MARATTAAGLSTKTPAPRAGITICHELVTVRGPSVSKCGLLRSTTMLSGVVGCAFFIVSVAYADPLFTKAPLAAVDPGPMPAVDGLNEKVDFFGGSVANRSLYGAEGSVGIPLAGPYGLQLDGNLGSLGGNGYGAAAGHLFWRNPGQGLLGVYGSFTEWDQNGGVWVSQIAGEGALYWGRWTFEGIAGVEFGNSVNSTSSITTTVPQAGVVPGVTTTSIFSTGFDVRTRFFDDINAKYYITDNWNAYVGHRYLGGKNALAFGSEIALPLGHGIEGAAFFEGVTGEDSFHGIWGGLKFYFGRADKPLIARHRQDDPPNWTTDSLFSIMNNNTGSSSTTTSQFCKPGETLVGGKCEDISTTR